MAQFDIKIEGLDKLEKAFARSPRETATEIAKGIKTSINIIRPMMKRNAPFASGKLRQNIYARYTQGEGVVGPDLNVTPYAIFVHEGTRAHIIRPKTKKALYWKGAKHPVKMVRHPGTKANPFVDKTYDESGPIVVKIFKNTIDNIVKNLAS